MSMKMSVCFELSCCPQCHQGISTSTNRLVQDSCGHKKCRMCLLQEDNGCLSCRNVARYADENDFSPSPPHDMDVDTLDSQHMSGTDSCHQMGEINSLRTCNTYNDDFSENTEEHQFQASYMEQKLICKSHENTQPSEEWGLGIEEPRSYEVLQPAVISMPHLVESNVSSNPLSENKSSVGSIQIPNPKPKVKTVRKRIVIPSYITVSKDCPPNYTCTICSKTFKARLHVRYHFYCDGSKKPFKCKTCNKEFIIKSHYDCHVRNHEGNRPFVCNTCNKSFTQKGKLTRHLRCHSAERAFVCSTCGRAFKNLDGLRNHQRTHSGNKPHRCTMCDRTFSDLSSLKQHSLTHTDEKNFMCDECGKSFKLKSNLSVHIAMHGQAQQYRCTICSRVFWLMKDLRRHHTTHSSHRPFDCSLCSCAFRRKDNFVRHMRNNHPHSEIPSIITVKSKSVGNLVQTQTLSPTQNKPSASTPTKTVHDATAAVANQVSFSRCNSNPSNRPGPKESLVHDKNIGVGIGHAFSVDSNTSIKNEAESLGTMPKLAAPEMTPKQPVNQGQYQAGTTSVSLKYNALEWYDRKKMGNDNQRSTSPPDFQSECQLNAEKNIHFPSREPNSHGGCSKTDAVPPKVLNYQAVSVINRSNVTAPSPESNVIRLGSRCEGSEPYNCVRTITRTSNIQSTRELSTSELVSKVVPSCEAIAPEIFGEVCDNPEKPTLRLYLSDVHWRKRMMELLNLKKEPTTDSLKFKGSDRTSDCLKERLVLNKKDGQTNESKSKSSSSQNSRRNNPKAPLQGLNSKYSRSRQTGKTVANKRAAKSCQPITLTKPINTQDKNSCQMSTDLQHNAEDRSFKCLSTQANNQQSSLPQPVLNGECVIVENTSMLK